MPITPFHFGPGAAFHALAPKQVSFLAFCSANVLMDLEPLYYMVTHQYPLHRFLHTYIGATLITIVTAILFSGALKLCSKIKLPNIFGWQNLRYGPVWIGAAIGSYTHIVLDSIMHADMVPFSPFSEINVLYQWISLAELHLFCLLSALVALFLIGLRSLFKKAT